MIIDAQKQMAKAQDIYDIHRYSLDPKQRKELFKHILQLDLLISNITKAMMDDVCLDIIEIQDLLNVAS